jgi:xanthosine utilization system XapX-like protein
VGGLLVNLGVGVGELASFVFFLLLIPLSSPPCAHRIFGLLGA